MLRIPLGRKRVASDSLLDRFLLLYHVAVGFEHRKNLLLAIIAQLLSLLRSQLTDQDRFPVFKSDMLPLDPRKMGFKDITGTGDRHRDDLAAGFFSDLKAALFKWEHVQLCLTIPACAFRIDTDGDTFFDLFDTNKNGPQALLHVFPFEKQTMKAFHPKGDQQKSSHAVFGDITGEPRTPGIGDHDIKIAAVVTDI